MRDTLNQFDPAKDYYSIIGAREGDSRREIERLYKQQAHKRHPDRGGAEDDMKTLNEAYRVLRDEKTRRVYDTQRNTRVKSSRSIPAAAAAREVGIYGQLLSALLCLLLGLMLLLLVRANGLWFLWPLSILALGVILFGVLIAHSAISNARESLALTHPYRRFRAAQEVAFWSLVCGSGYGLYLILSWF